MVKYRIDYRNYFNELCRVDIGTSSYSGDIIPVLGTEGQACVISYDIGDDPYEPICNSKAAISIIQEGQIDTEELKQAKDKDFTVDFYIEGEIKWKGYLIPDGIQSSFQSTPFDLSITATDGLMLLDGIDFITSNPEGGRCILNYYREILFKESLLGVPLPIRWVNTLTNDEFPDELDIFTGSVKWSSRGEGFTDYNPDPNKSIRKSCLYVIEEMTRSLQSRIFQADGYWKVERINDVVTGEYSYRETPATTSGFMISDPVFVNVLKTISSTSLESDYSFIEEDAYLRTAKALGTVKTTYEQDQRENILPNGNMDIVEQTLDNPLYWRLLNPANGLVSSENSLYATRGSSVKIKTLNGSNIFRLQSGGLPIDTDVLYTYINFGFKFSIETWAGVDANGYIIWGEQAPFAVQVIYYAGDDTYYLNEFGSWSIEFQQIFVEIPNFKVGDVTQVDFNKQQDITIPLPNIPILRTFTPEVYVGFNLKPNLSILFDDIYINTGSNSDVYEASANIGYTAKEEYTLNISSSHNGFYVSNYMTDYSRSGLEKFFSDGITHGVTMTEMNSCAILRNRYKPSQLFDGSIYGKDWSFGELYNIETLTGKTFMPLRNSWNTETCTINMTAIEVRDDNISISVKHYGSNDNEQKLSN
jgi:hypothetical protein